jgi:outer membrane lipoprotein-sorting protein
MKPGIVLAAALLAAAPPLVGQTLDEIVAKNLQARGGLEKLTSIQSVRMSGTLTLGPGRQAGISMEFRRPKMVRTEYMIQGRTAVQAYDGRTAWQIMPFEGKTEAERMTGDDAKSMEEQADVEGELVGWRGKGLAVELLGRETVDGVDAWKLRISRKSGDAKTMWLDAATFLEFREESERKVQGKDVVYVTTLSDYRDVGGRKVPFVTESRAKDGSGRQTITLVTVEFDVPIEPSLFRMPEPKPTASPAPKK